MSGTSLDGLDLAATEYRYDGKRWRFAVFATETVTYSKMWEAKLSNAPLLSGEQLMNLDAEYGCFIGKQVNQFIQKTGFVPDFVASHGHTVFHQPEKHFTFQIGNGANIAATTKIKTVADFRTLDVALGGQGAPLVPVGDKLLFPEFSFCLNLGGFANISYTKKSESVAFDVCPANIALNYFAEKQGLKFDESGELGKKGNIDHRLLQHLNNLAYYRQQPPKSLGREWLKNIFLPAVESFNIPESDKLRTIYEHIAIQIAKSLPEKGKMLITGGGAFNTFLIDRLTKNTNIELVLPNPQTIKYKEAIIFGFLGVLRISEQIN
ncbi:MAG: anhydro-N-acetylmuramic acid kinase, partial [Prolixibacteraceae bacterium]|nr:anhydro-N-acetylmuramic acid kinase [Prolixibacteraceae bacterium]